MDYELSEPIINQINLSGNNQITSIELRSNITGIKDSYHRLMPAKLYTYLGNKRKRKDSLKIKPSFIQFFKTPNPVYSSVWLENSQKQIQRYYRENGFLKTTVYPKIDTFNKLLNITFVINEGDISYFSKDDSVSVDNPILAAHVTAYLKNNSLIRPNGRLQFATLKKEKENLSHHLRNEGYYYFSSDAIGIRLNDLKDSTSRRAGISSIKQRIDD
jgi:outer membrane protein assembly factor BamA